MSLTIRVSLAGAPYDRIAVSSGHDGSERKRRPVTYTFERESRTPYSESWVVESDGEAVGRVDLHFASTGFVHATLCVPRDFDDDDIETLIAEIDERVVLPADAYRDDFVVTVWRGERVGVYSEDDDEDEESGNGALPHP
jgi:hypothetical protein